MATSNSINFACQNLCGLHKLTRHQHTLSLLRSSAIVFVQESLQLTPTKLFPGYMVFDVPAVLTRGRPSGGLTTLLQRSTFG